MAGSVVVLVLLGMLAGLVGPWLLHQIDVDKCLDRGGAFDYDNNKCIFAPGKVTTSLK